MSEVSYRWHDGNGQWIETTIPGPRWDHLACNFYKAYPQGKLQFIREV